MDLPRAIHVIAAGHRHPDQTLDNETLASHVPGLSRDWPEKYLGMSSRRVLGVEERSVDLVVEALDDALRTAGWRSESLQGIVYGTGFPDQVAPAAASYVARDTNPSAIAFDVNTVCSSFLYAVAASVGLLSTDPGLSRVAACSGEHATAYADYTDPRSSVFWGDSGAAVLLTTEQPSTGSFRIVDIALNGDHEYPEKVFVPRHGHFRSDGRYSYKQVVRLCSEASRTLLLRNHVDIDEVAGAAFHQANVRMLKVLGDELGLPFERQWHNLEWAGNQAAAGVATAFSNGWTTHASELTDGDYVLLASVGGGYTGAAVLLRWVSA